MAKRAGTRPTIPPHETPLPPAGESTRRMGSELVERWNNGPLLFAAFTSSLAFVAWWGWLFPIDPLLVAGVWTALAAAVWVWAVRSGVRMERRRARYEQGLEGERYVATVLGVPQDGRRYHVIHDVPGDGGAGAKERWNIDHVVIGWSGVYAIETKCWTKPPRKSDPRKSGTGKASIAVRDGKLWDGQGRPLPEEYQQALGQAEASARRVSQMLKEAFGENVAVRPVLLIVGWWVEERGQDFDKPGSVWTLNAKQFYKYANRPPEGGERLSDADAGRYAEHLRHVVRRAVQDEG